jgi:hypothetical protein
VYNVNIHDYTTNGLELKIWADKSYTKRLNSRAKYFWYNRNSYRGYCLKVAKIFWGKINIKKVSRSRINKDLSDGENWVAIQILNIKIFQNITLPTRQQNLLTYTCYWRQSWREFHKCARQCLCLHHNRSSSMTSHFRFDWQKR